MQFTVETGGLRASVAAVEEALARLERVRVADDLASMGAAFRGGETAALTGQVCTVWGRRLAALRWQVRSTGAALEVAAAGYDAVEEVARRALGSPGSLGGAVTGVSVADLRAARPEVLSAVARRVEEHRHAVGGGPRGRAARPVGGPLGVGRRDAVAASRWSGPAASAAGGPVLRPRC